ncbi:MAG: TetR/AcrR family transcriptional regulator [Frankia sp.]
METTNGERERLLGLIADHLLESGVSTVTLRGIATAVGSNNRMLLYYFGSKERLVADGIAEAAGRFPVFGRALAGIHGRQQPIAAWLDAVWRDISDEANTPYLRLFFELFGLAAHRPDRYGPFLESVGSDWVELVGRSLRTDGVPADDAQDLAIEVVALWRGLQFALLSGADRAALDRSHTEAARSIERRAHGADRAPRRLNGAPRPL